MEQSHLFDDSDKLKWHDNESLEIEKKAFRNEGIHLKNIGSLFNNSNHFSQFQSIVAA